ncbi:putative GTP cyclohydrolase 1 type 2 [uncultured Desulfobacterium sp.]|uniref:GTP cyclohydrolase 1 type 2 homolog n=1 Tax=uncultured Desulfobacterium sp. TaxID=201089 RepID=A0A445MTL7_9BACT|nr:putative GTP cyclohydrolase 1 type 2 [uncultured Desulfobacterium sp.]
MLPKTSDVLDLIESIAPKRLAETWDNPGIQVGSTDQGIKKILVALDPTVEALSYAINAHADLLFTHHPLIFTPLSQVVADGYPGNVITRAIKNGISIIAAHTNLDIAPEGINKVLSDMISLRQVEVLEENPLMEGSGLGRLGYLPEPVGLQKIVEQIMQTFGCKRPHLVHSNSDVLIHRIAVVGGSGGGLIPLAAKKKADLMITGDIGHHHALTAKTLGIALVDAGHFNLERAAFFGFAKLFGQMAARLKWDIEVTTYPDEENPMILYG